MDKVKKIIEIISKYSSKGIYMGDNIPEEKLKNASAYFPIDNPEEVFCLIDSTVSGSCKVGLAFLKNGIQWQNDWMTKSSVTKLSWNQLKERENLIRLNNYGISFGKGSLFNMTGATMNKVDAFNLFKEVASFLNTDDSKTHQIKNSSEIINAMNKVKKIMEIISNYLSKGIYMGDNIPEEKLKNASAYFPIDNPEEVFCLIDSTVSGSCKVGLAFLKNGIQWQNDWMTKSSVTKLSWKQLKERKRYISLNKHDIFFGKGAMFNMSGATMNKVDAFHLFKEVASFLQAYDENRSQINNGFDTPTKFYGKRLLISNGLYCEENQEQPYTGIGWMHEYENGQIESKAHYKDGKMHGEAINYYEDGQIASIGHYKDGKLHGEFISYYENGQIESEVQFIDGELHGEFIMYYENTQIKLKGYYTDGERDGEFIRYYENGEIASIGQYINGELK